MATTKPTFQNQTSRVLSAPRYNLPSVDVAPSKYVVGNYYLSYNYVGGISTGLRIYETLGFTNVSSGNDPSASNIVYDYDAAVAASPVGSSIPLSQKGVASGVATLDENALIPESQLPSGSGALASGVTALTDDTPTAFATFPILDGQDFIGEIPYKVRSIKGTAIQSLASRVRFSTTREGNTYKYSISEVGAQTLSADVGTLTGAISISCADSVCTLSAQFNTSQASPDSFVIKYDFESVDTDLNVTTIP